MSDANNFWTIVYIDDNGIGKGYTGDKNVVEFVKKELAPIGWRIEGSVVDFNLSEGFMDMTTKLATTDGGWLSVKISEGTTHGLDTAVKGVQRLKAAIKKAQNNLHKAYRVLGSAEDSYQKVDDVSKKAQDDMHTAMDALKEAREKFEKTITEADKDLEEAQEIALEADRQYDKATDAVLDAEETVANAKKEQTRKKKHLKTIDQIPDTCMTIPKERLDEFLSSDKNWSPLGGVTFSPVQ